MTKHNSSLQKCQKTIGYKFSDVNLLEQALTHASVADDRLGSNERLEFLGDAILGSVVCQELFTRFPDYLEGELTKIKSMIVSRRTCARLADDLELVQYLHVGKGMITQNGLPGSCKAAAIESLIAAVYLDGGDQAARDFILRLVSPLLDGADAKQHQGNFKSMLQQHAQRVMGVTPSYELLDEKGPDHSKCFEVGVVIGKKRFPTGWGPSKKDAEQLAAFRALQHLKIIPEDTPLPTITDQ